jgi:hypothetical protein
VPSNTLGSSVILEGLSKYGAMMVYQKRFGESSIRQILRSDAANYITMHQIRARDENPLVKANMEYIWNSKAAIVLYGLQDLIGEKKLNSALWEFHEKFASKNTGVYAGTTDLLKILRKHVPDSLQYYLTDSWEKITTYDNKVLNAKITPTNNPEEYQIKIELQIGKSYAQNGIESTAEVNDYIDVGVFGIETSNQPEAALDHPLYLKRIRCTGGHFVMNVMVKGRPVRVAVDPYMKLIDKNQGDNIKDLTVGQ